MSRIHEALKRAEQERLSKSTLTAGAAPTSTVELSAPESADARSGINGQGEHGSSFDFTELWNRASQPGWLLHPEQNVFANPDAPPIFGEQFRILRSRLYQIRETQPIRTILVTSGHPGEGKTFIAANLAQALARRKGTRVLLIDADLRCSNLHAVLGTRSTPGLSEYLGGGVDPVGILQKGFSEYLCFIAAGSGAAHPADLISNGRLKDLLNQFSSAFDWIILDSPPAFSIADANVLAGLCDGVVFVVRPGSTPVGALQKIHQELPGRNIIGVIMNAVDQSQVYGSYSYNAYLGAKSKHTPRTSLSIANTDLQSILPVKVPDEASNT